MINVNKLKEEQLKLAKKILISDGFEKIKTMAGVEQAFTQDQIISQVVVCDYKTLEIKEKKQVIVEQKIPYISSYLFYREGPAILEAFNQLEEKPDVLIVNGHGILHPRRIGMASHVGILLDIPTIGVAKKQMLGEVKEGTIYSDKEALGYEFFTRKHANPLYISPGHKMSLKSSKEIIKKCIKYPHKLPEPLHIAHKLANKTRKELSKKD
ncbi:endonuclease V [Candidatus Woesearchaeota archaeon]|nr:endonuclease V [Candidatus Woesearchaeota archaeon]